MLYAMAGVYTTLLPGWRSQEELSALYLVRQCMLQCMERFVSQMSQGLNRRDCQEELDKSLEKIRLVRLQKPIHSKPKNVLVPLVDSGTIMMNGNVASFADIIGPATLIQAKHSQSPYELCPVYLYKEVKKCGLVNEEDSDTRLLRGLIAIWKNSAIRAKVQIDSKKSRSTASSKFQRDLRKIFCLL